VKPDTKAIVDESLEEGDDFALSNKAREVLCFVDGNKNLCQ
jgi:hypothetical protein